MLGEAQPAHDGTHQNQRRDQLRVVEGAVQRQQTAKRAADQRRRPVRDRTRDLRQVLDERIRQDGEWRDGDTSFLKVNVWRGQAEHLADSLSKDDRVMITGRLRQRGWETPEGERRSVTEIEADEVGPSLKFAIAKVERATSDRSQARERQAERGGDFNDAPPF
jgi:single-stranded DNA-binding protein